MNHSFDRMLIANRGEIALRAVRAAHELGLEAGLLYTEPEATTRILKMADAAHEITGQPAYKAYLDGEQIIRLAKQEGYEAIYPGYGFLAENPHFAALCEEAGIVFIGPRSSVLAALGNKRQAKLLAEAAGLPVLKSYAVAGAALSDVLHGAEEVGFPLLVKATNGGGGRGIKRVNHESELLGALEQAQREAGAAFGEADVYLEHLLQNTRHIEFQVMADVNGNVIHLGERECSIQRRYQKIIEEAPVQDLSLEQRQHYGQLSCELIRSVGLVGVATVEFLWDSATGLLYFIEVNPRIQVEHGITELVCGVDLVKWQIRLAQGEPLSYAQADIHWRGHAVECRLNAEDPRQNFRPSAGVLAECHMPAGNGVRVCNSTYAGEMISAEFDTLFSKIMTWGEDRLEAITRMQRALRETTVVGVETTLPLLRAIVVSEAFVFGRVSTALMDQLNLGQMLPQEDKPQQLGFNHLEPLSESQVADLTRQIYASLHKQAVSTPERRWAGVARHEQVTER